MNKEEIIFKIKAFVEGKLEAQEIVKLYALDIAFREFCNNCNSPHLEYDYKTFENFMQKFNTKNPIHISRLSNYLHYYLYTLNVECTLADKYLLDAQNYSKVYPSWLSDNAYDYIESYIEPQMPKNLTQKQQKLWLKEQIKLTFKYEKKPPQFVQGGEWPLDENNKPLVFRKQITKGEQVTFVFVDEQTKEETTYEECY